MKIHREYSGPRALLACVAFTKLWQSWVAAFVFTNMWSERLLARFRRNCRVHGTPDSERLISIGMLSQMLAEHTKLGFDDPRVQSKEALLQAGVPLQCKKPERQRASRPRSAFVNYITKRNEARKEAGVVFNKDQWQQFQKACIRDFGNLSEAERAVEDAEARAAWAQGQEEEDDDVAEVGLDAFVTTFLSSVGSRETPFSAEHFGKIARQIAGPRQKDRDPGFLSYSQTLRDEQARAMFVKDVGSVPEEDVFTYYVPCTIAHPGLCASVDGDMLLTVRSVAKTLQHGIGKLASGTFFVAVFKSRLKTWQTWFSLAYVRGGGPRLLMLCDAERTDNVVALQFVSECAADVLA